MTQIWIYQNSQEAEKVQGKKKNKSNTPRKMANLLIDGVEFKSQTNIHPNSSHPPPCSFNHRNWKFCFCEFNACLFLLVPYRQRNPLKPQDGLSVISRDHRDRPSRESRVQRLYHVAFTLILCFCRKKDVIIFYTVIIIKL